MTFLNMLYNLLIMPLQIVFEYVYDLAYEIIGNPGLAIIALSLAMNLLVLPLYNRADAIQEEEREIEEKLRNGVEHIKKTFKGDEKTMMLQTYYRQNHYSPTDVFKCSISLLLQIPFFIAAYRFLSGLELIQGLPFGPIADLGQPDALITVAGMSINLLPVIMTGINVISTILFTKGQPFKSKIQLYVLAAFFLVFLYNSPSGLVFYWTLNNVFSLCKTILYKMENRDRVTRGISAVTSAFCFFFGIYTYINGASGVQLFCFFLIGLLLFLPLLLPFLTRKSTESHQNLFRLFGDIKPNRKCFLICGIFLSVLVGLLIPSAVIKASPQEFVNTAYFFHPLWYMVSSFLIAAGTFIIWFGVFYRLFSEKAKVVFESILWAACGIALVNYFFFGKNLGIIDANLKYENGLIFTILDRWINLLVVVGIVILMFAVFVKFRKTIGKVLSIMVIAVICLISVNSVGIAGSIAEIDLSEGSSPEISLSQTGKNVVVIMLDRAMGEYVPYMFNEKPELKEKFSGFTYYRNTISFGAYTNFASPAVYGGYEYTPTALNARADESLESKHNEALKVMPVIFDNAGYDVTVINPSYAGYQWIPDLSIYDDYPEIKKYNISGYFTESDEFETLVNHRLSNFYCYGLMKIFPVSLQPFFYGDGQYALSGDAVSYSVQKTQGTSIGEGFSASFMDEYLSLTHMTGITKITNDEAGCFLMLTNDMTHEPCLLQEPGYEPQFSVNNTEYEQKIRDRFSLNGKRLITENEDQYAHYETNMAAMIQLGKWFDVLKEKGVYDNTRIILVSDHGRDTMQNEDLILDHAEDDMTGLYDAEFYFPLLMVKDFNADTFSISDTFMTNADVPLIATNALLDEAVNPFTGKRISNKEKGKEQHIIASEEIDVNLNNGNQFLPARWYSVRDSIWNKKNWKLITENDVLTK